MAECGVSVGRRARSRREAQLRLSVVALVVAALLAGCAGESEGNGVVSLLDGSSAGKAPVELEGVDRGTVLTSATAIAINAIEPDSAAASCLRDEFAELDARGSAVVRVGVASESVTFEEASRQGIFACSNSAGPREENRRWCDGAYGQLYSGRLRDPRLSSLCKTTDGSYVGSVWVQPGDDVRYVAVEQPEYTEVYEVAGGLPIRIFTVSGVDVETSSATFDISEHDAGGRRLRDYELKAFVAG
jgi:hypothetical protein